MRVVKQETSFLYLPEDDGPELKMLMGTRARRNDPWYIVEDNLVNRIVLGVTLPPASSIMLQHADGLLPYQSDDISKMLSITATLNANPMGLGKTVEAICLLKEASARNGLIVVPKIIRSQWQAQAARWWPEAAHRFKIWEGTKDQRVLDDDTFWIINYEKLSAKLTTQKFRSVLWHFMLVDEAHRIKNRNSQRTVAVKSIPNQRRVALTGTPILRYVDDLWSILNWLDVQYSGKSYWNFVNYFCEVDEGPYGRTIEGLTDDPARVAILNTVLSYFTIRNEVTVAKGKTKETITLSMPKKQLKVYKDLRNLALDELPEGMTVANGAVLTTRLRQLTSWPGLFLEGEAGPKFEYVLELMRDNPETKLVVFSAFEKSVAALQRYLREGGIGCVTITGQNKPDHNELSKDLFTHGNAQVLAGTIGSMGQGYDGLQHVCRLMVFLDRDWSPEIMEQCEDRLNRMGQQYPVLIQYLECEKSFDQYVGKVNAHKAADIKAALEVTG